MTVLALTAIAGCDSTQQQAARARLKAARFIASSGRTVVRRRNPDVRVLAVTLLRGSRGSAIAVRLRNRSLRPRNDLPISVGIVARGGRETYLNAAANTYYFETHLASIGARRSATWVFTTSDALPAGATPVAAVGARPSVPATTVRSLPRLEVAAVGSPTRSKLHIKVTNASAVPQYQVQIYALGLARGRYVAAGRATIGHLGTQSSAIVTLTLIGGPRPTSIELEALPTMFQ